VDTSIGAKRADHVNIDPRFMEIEQERRAPRQQMLSLASAPRRSRDEDIAMRRQQSSTA
jgi:hypothetical protein